MNIAQFEVMVQEIAGNGYYACCREDYRKRGKRVVTWSAYTERAGWVGVKAKGNKPDDVIAQLRRIHGGQHSGVDHVA